MVDDFFCFLASNLPSVTNGDCLKWRLTNNEDFTIHSFYQSYMVVLPLLFHGKVFGRLRHPGISLSSFGQPHGIGSSREIS